MTTEPTTSAEYFARGLKSAQLGQPDAAARDFEEAAWLDPDNATIQFNLGTAYLSMGLFEQAVINLDRSLELDPNSSDALGNRAVARTALGQDELAAEDITRAIELGAPPDGIQRRCRVRQTTAEATGVTSRVRGVRRAPVIWDYDPLRHLTSR